MKKALIIGAAGFVGRYLVSHLHALGWSVFATKMMNEQMELPYGQVIELNVLQQEEINRLLQKTRPDYVFHLAAQSSVALSWANPRLTIDVNVQGVVNLLETVRGLDYKPRILLVGSGEEYGHIRQDGYPITEETLLRPGNIYAVSKACQNMLGKVYADAYKMGIINVRAFNHIGPGQSPIYVVASFCKQVAEIEAGLKEPVLKVGNLSARRDFTDVRDVVRAYASLIESGEPGETYNVGSGRAISIQEILDMILTHTAANIRVEIDPSHFRPVDVPIIEADIRKLQQVTSWKPEIELQVTIREVLESWRGGILDKL